ncbi:hypothetical protein ACN47E_005655 [Coniothyrium glycines]
MTAHVGGLSISIIAVIAVAGIFGLLALIIITAVILDIPKRMKRKADKGIVEPSSKRSMEISEAEKGSINVSVNEVSSQNSLANYSNHQRPASPDCNCEHPVVQNPPRI